MDSSVFSWNLSQESVFVLGLVCLYLGCVSFLVTRVSLLGTCLSTSVSVLNFGRVSGRVSVLNFGRVSDITGDMSQDVSLS